MVNFRQCDGPTLHVAHSWFNSDPTSPMGYSWFACMGKAEEIPIVDKSCLNTGPHKPHYSWTRSYDCPGVPDPAAEPTYPAYWQEIFDNIPQEAVDAFTEAWEAKRKEIGRGIAPKDTKTRAGLTAFMKALYELQVL